jgi:hypothetical protein
MRNIQDITNANIERQEKINQIAINKSNQRYNELVSNN